MNETYNEAFCDQCENSCPRESLKCNRGRLRYGLEPAPHGPMKAMMDLPGPLKSLMECGHLLRHGGLEEGELLSALSGEEREELEKLLEKLLADWRARVRQKAQDRQDPGR